MALQQRGCFKLDFHCGTHYGRPVMFEGDCARLLGSAPYSSTSGAPHPLSAVPVSTPAWGFASGFVP